MVQAMARRALFAVIVLVEALAMTTTLVQATPNKCNPYPCGFKTMCLSNGDSYLCSCLNGYAFNRTRYECQDIDECAQGACGLHGTCQNQDGGFYCHCASGFHYSPTTRQCIKHDNCVRYPCPESPSHTCTRTHDGISLCVLDGGGDNCPTGYRKTSYGCVDDNECLRAPCGPNMHCTNSVGNYSCTCDRGYSLSPDGTVCRDVDECITGTHHCEGTQYCLNQIGHYRCPCKAGFYTYHNGKCYKKNECFTHTCTEPNTKCVDVYGSFACVCKTGFGGPFCEDVDECLQPGRCLSPNTQCRNQAHGFSCGCKPGYRGSDCTRKV
ncbi:fibulin-1-like [Sycon ciliatum]|uniref:fibulin-1-like n=1 Tax=Sycon ciliatum TaxID=27933 RepID=UPI0020AD285B|eukprot:scpid86756/ scgid14487/ Fibrillin-1